MSPDDIVLNFTPATLVLLNVVLGLIMFGIALDTPVADFKAVARKPKAFAIAIVAQLVILPAVTFGLTLILPVTPSIALGMILVACCPPGNISQVLTHRSGGSVALSVSMTAVGNLLYGTPFIAPLIGLNNPKSAMAYGGLMGTTSGVAGGLAATDKRLVPYGAMTATFYTGLGCLLGPSVFYFALRLLLGG